MATQGVALKASAGELPDGKCLPNASIDEWQVR